MHNAEIPDSTKKILLEPYEYLLQYPGKEIRSKLIEGFQLWLDVPKDKLETIKHIVEMLHTASLLVDDVEDGSDLRRGVPVAHKIYGVASTINTANYVYFLGLEKVLTLHDERAVRVFTEELLQLHVGQGMEIHWRDSVQCPSEDEYLTMVKNKTGGLLRLGVKLMQLFSTATVDYVPIVNLLGIHFQVRDDYINLKSTTYQEGKGFAEDLTEGKFSYPIVRCIHSDPSTKSQLNHILRQRTHDVDLKRYAIQVLEGAGAFRQTQAFLEGMEREARSEIQRLGGNVVLEGILERLSAGWHSE
ncbi:isoprenoid synthase domain-containing protein [Entophlyctis helioformis]|nr:isoprenoid synthase domain-containing protein [Entophlyctis helioformis]